MVIGPWAVARKALRTFLEGVSPETPQGIENSPDPKPLPCLCAVVSSFPRPAVAHVLFVSCYPPPSALQEHVRVLIYLRVLIFFVFLFERPPCAVFTALLVCRYMAEVKVHSPSFWFDDSDSDTVHVVQPWETSTS